MGRELAVRSSEALDLREVAARITLDCVRQKGHVYVELRRAGKRTIFFCTLCLTSCYSDDVLFEHLGGGLHARRYAAAKTTLFGPDPWPFSDGVLFFNPSSERQLIDNEVRVKAADGCRTVRVGVDQRLPMSVIGVGHVGTRVEQVEEGRSKISRIWCAWLGRAESADGVMVLPKCDFAIVCFKYTYDLGRHWALGEMNSPRSECSWMDNDDSRGKKRKKSFSDPEDSCDSASGGASQHLQLSRFNSSKSFRRDLRRRKRLAAEKTCDICAQEMIPGKDVGALLNCRTGNLACSSRNTNMAFHLFHVSCLVHWILLCEFELRTDQLGYVKSRGRKRRDALSKPLSSVFCPECQGTGKHIIGEELEKPTIPLSEVFLYKLKALEAHKAWMKNPEVLKKCSTGLHFPCNSDKEYQEKVVPVKLLRFYGVDREKSKGGTLGLITGKHAVSDT